MVSNVGSIVTVELMGHADAWFPRARLDATEMAQLAAVAHEILGYDIIPVFNVVQQSAALG